MLKPRTLGALLFSVTACGPVDRGAQSATSRQESPIVDGQACTDGEFASAGVLLTRGSYEGNQRAGLFCSGTLIAADVVLSAGHCTEVAQSFWGGQGEGIENFFSLALDVQAFGRSTAVPPAPAHAVSRMLAHPDYDRANFNLHPVGLAALADLGLVFLRDPVTEVLPAALPIGDASALLISTEAVDIVGYGQTSAASADGIKRKARSFINEINDSEMQIGDATPTPVTCLGDSGGPTYLDVDDGRVPARRLVGITSRAYDSGVCETGGIAMRTDAHRDWIVQSLIEACDSGLRDPVFCDEAGGLRLPSAPRVEQKPPADLVTPGGCDCRAQSRRGTPVWMLLVLSLGLARRRPLPHSSRSATQAQLCTHDRSPEGSP